MKTKNEIKLLFLSLLFSSGILGTSFWVLVPPLRNLLYSLICCNNNKPTSAFKQEQTSLGDQILVKANTNNDKQAGTEAFAKEDYSTAISKFQSALQKHRNDPEALIYLNNAKARASNRGILTIVVSVPVGGNLNVAQEILRGVAQAQDEVNRHNGINGKLLQVEIANDNNDPDTAKELAAEFSRDSKILAIVGHNSSNTSIAAAPVYQQAGLVMVTPTSTSSKLPGVGSYVFRTVPSSSLDADTLSQYATKTARLKKIAICADSQDTASQSIKEEFIKDIKANGQGVTPTDCDFSDPKFNPNTVVTTAISEGAEGLLLAPAVNKISQAVEVAKANQHRLALFSYSVMYTWQTLQFGQKDVNGMVLTVAWHPTAIPGNQFPKNATKLWGGPVSWRTATSYDATQAIIAGLKQNQTRLGLQLTLASPQFSTIGAMGTIQFQSGERKAKPVFVRVQGGNQSGTGYDFSPLSP